jgi:putative transposase
VFVEDLNITGMMKNHCLARSISDVGWGELIRQLSYKTQVHKVDRFFPSSKTCSGCGYKLEKLDLKVRDWTCPACATQHDRDINAAINILVEGQRKLSATGSYLGSNACEEESSDLTSMKQEKQLEILNSVTK